MRTPSSTWWRAASTTNGEPGAYPRAMPRLLTAPISLPQDAGTGSRSTCPGRDRLLGGVSDAGHGRDPLLHDDLAGHPLLGASSAPTHRGGQESRRRALSQATISGSRWSKKSYVPASGVAMASLWASVSSKSGASMFSGAQREPPRRQEAFDNLMHQNPHRSHR